MKSRYFIFLSFKGESYHGWQIQPNSVTVQEILEDALSTILGENISTTGAGRTDTGVHASFFCAHFESVKDNLSANRNVIFRLNRYLPKDIAVSGIIKVIPDANARFSALSRTYKYFVSVRKDPFTEDSSWFIHGDLDTEAMNQAAAYLCKVTDFTSFARLHSDTATNDCKVFEAVWTKEGDRLIFTIKADRFLRNMVRAIVGTLIEIGIGKMDIREFIEITEAKDRCRAGKSAPAKGLFLTSIEYPESLFSI